MVLALHFGPVRSDAAAPDTMNSLFLAAATELTARATPEFGTSMIMSTLSTSNHWLAMVVPTSGLFWWSALTSSPFTSLLLAVKSAIAILAAATEPGPPIS